MKLQLYRNLPLVARFCSGTILANGVSQPFASQFQSTCPSPFLIARAERQWTLLRSLRSHRPRGPRPRNPPPALLPAALLVRSDTGDVERLRAQHEAWQKCQLQPQTCPDQFCFQWKLCVRHGVGKKQVHGQMATRAAEFHCGSQSLLCFLLCLYRALSKAKVFTQYERQTSFFLPQNLRTVMHAAKVQESRNGARGSSSLWRPRYTYCLVAKETPPNTLHIILPNPGSRGHPFANSLQGKELWCLPCILVLKWICHALLRISPKLSVPSFSHTQ